MKSILLFVIFLSPLNLFANDAINSLRTRADLDGLIINYCTLKNKVCSKIDRSKPNLLFMQAVDMVPAASEAMESLKANFESLRMTYKISDLPDQESRIKISYIRPKTSK